MKPGIHPTYPPVVFRDTAADFALLTRSTATSDMGAPPAGAKSRVGDIEWEDGKTYPVIDVEISSQCHPFHTDTARVLYTAGRVERFEQRYNRRGAR